MNNLKTILKYSLIQNLGINRIGKNKQKSKKVGIGLGILLVYLVIFAVVSLYMFMFLDLFNQIGEPQMVFLLGITLSSILVFFSTLPKANSYIFRTKDYDFLMSMPVSSKVVVSSKIINLYLMNLLFCFTIMFSIEIVYFISCGFDLSIAIFYFIAIFFVPLFPTAVGALIAYLLGFIPLRQKVKNILSTLLYLVFTMAIMLGYFALLNASEENPEMQITSIYEILSKAYFIGGWAYNGIYGNVLQYLLFILVSIISMAVLVLLTSINFKNYSSSRNRSETNKNYHLSQEKYMSSKGEVRALFNKELKIYIGLPMYIMNTIIGPILSIIGTVMLSLNYKSMVESIVVFEDVNPDAIIMPIVILVLIFCICLVSTTSSSISLEGKSFWILKSAPVKTKSVFFAKSLINLMITIPFIIINTIICMFMIDASYIFYLCCLIVPSIYAVAMSFMGIFFNLLCPRFDYDNPIKAIKQGVSVLLNMLFGMFLSIVNFVFFIAFSSSTVILVLAFLGFSILILILSIALTFTLGIKKYEKLSA